MSVPGREWGGRGLGPHQASREVGGGLTSPGWEEEAKVRIPLLGVEFPESLLHIPLLSGF